MISTAEGDIIELVGSQGVECIINPANAELSEGGTLCGQIYKAAGSDALNQKLLGTRGIGEGSSVLTGGSHLCEYIIHTLAPRDTSYKRWDKLAGCYLSILDIADVLLEQGLISTIAIPAIGTGVFNLPIDQADEVAWNTVSNWQDNRAGTHGFEVVFCFKDQVRYQKMRERGADQFFWDDVDYRNLCRAEGGYGE